MKMRLANTEFLSEYGGRLPAGAVLDVDEATAARWFGLGIAKKASSGTKTFQEERRERLLEQMEEDALNGPEPGVFDASLGRGETDGEDDEEEDAPPARTARPTRAATSAAPTGGHGRAAAPSPRGVVSGPAPAPAPTAAGAPKDGPSDGERGT